VANDKLSKSGPNNGGLSNIENLRSIQWETTYSWDIKIMPGNIQPPPNNFKDWFPAIEVDIIQTTTDSFKWRYYGYDFQTPYRRGSRIMKLTFLDSMDAELEIWFRKWIDEDLHNKGKFVSNWRDKYANFQVKRLKPDREIVNIPHIYHVVPTSTTITYKGTSASNVQQKAIDLLIVGDEFSNFASG